MGIGSSMGTASSIANMEGMMADETAMAQVNMQGTELSGRLSAEQATTKALANVMTSGANAVAQAAGQAH